MFSGEGSFVARNFIGDPSAAGHEEVYEQHPGAKADINSRCLRGPKGPLFHRYRGALANFPATSGEILGLTEHVLHLAQQRSQ